MKEIKLSPIELKRAIDNGKYLGNGYFGTVFTYKNCLIKLDNSLYNLLKTSQENNVRSNIERYYEHPHHEDFDRLSQIEELVKRQKNVTLTKLPEGIITLKEVDAKTKGIIPGILIPYHRNHQNLNVLNANDYKTLLIILKKLLLEVRELADNEIAQEDFGKIDKKTKKRDYNILYKDDTPQIIDLSGIMIRVGRDFRGAIAMYRGLGEVILDYFRYNNLESPYREYDIEDDKQIEFLLKELERGMKGKKR